jgi:hypothetical protein
MHFTRLLSVVLGNKMRYQQKDNDKMRFLTPFFLTLIFLCTSLAYASDEGVYIGVNGIYGNIDLQDTTVNGQTYTPDNSTTYGGGITAGYNLSKNFALEAAFDGLNKVDYQGNDAPSRNYWFTYAAVKPMLDFYNFNLYGEVGAAYVSSTQNNPSGIDNTTSSAVSPFGGLGIGFNFTPNVELDLSINRIQDTATPITFGMLTLSYHSVTRYEQSGFIAD